MEQQVKDLFIANMPGWNIDYFVTLRPDQKFKIVASGQEIKMKVFTAEVRRNSEGPYLFIDCD